MNDSAATERAALILELRRQGISDDRVLAAIEATPRERFVPTTFRERAWSDIALPIASGQTISQPYVVAFMTEALKLGPRLKVLEIGTGSGYQAAVLARLCRRVYTIERHKPLLADAQKHFDELGLANITAKAGDGMKGWPEIAPFERILITAAAEQVPPALLEQLSPDGGIMILPVGPQHYDQWIVRITRHGTDYQREQLLPVRFVPLLPGLA